jgi:hypothetical protein
MIFCKKLRGSREERVIQKTDVDGTFDEAVFLPFLQVVKAPAEIGDGALRPVVVVDTNPAGNIKVAKVKNKKTNPKIGLIFGVYQLPNSDANT